MISNSRIKELRAKHGLSEGRSSDKCDLDREQIADPHRTSEDQSSRWLSSYDGSQTSESSMRDFRMYSGVSSFGKREIDDRMVINEMKRIIAGDPALRTMVARLPELARKSAIGLGISEATHDLNKNELCRVLGLAMTEVAQEEFSNRR